MKKSAPENAPAKPPRGRPSRRPQILAATEKLLRTQGLATVTTRSIAVEAGCSEAAIYVHFKGRLELLLAVLEENLPTMLVPLKALEHSVGKSTPHKNLDRVLRAIFAFHQHVVPTLCSLFADPPLLTAYRDNLLGRGGKGPAGAIARLRKYIREEQKIGRLDKRIDAEFAASTLMSSSFFRAFTDHFLGREESFNATSKSLVESLFGSKLP
ncbi:MAG: TetR family transcriptional regulator [Acidobacteriaceae bacterium]|nr:TetR family transcriptional regulator [Acidobacteriaceae bacterium]